MPFGKHFQKTLGQIADCDPLYLDWLAGADIKRADLREAILAVHAKHIDEIDRLLEDRAANPLRR